MSHMEDLDSQLSERERQQRVHDTAMRALARQRTLREGEGLGLMFAWNAFGELSQKNTGLGRLSRFAAMLCIGFAFLTPCLLFARYML